MDVVWVVVVGVVVVCVDVVWVVVVIVVVDVSVVFVVVLVVDVPLDCVVPPPQCWAFPLLPSLPQLPLSGFPPVLFPALVAVPAAALAVPAAPVAVFRSFVRPDPTRGSESAFTPVPGASVDCVTAGFSGAGRGSAMAKAQPTPHRHRPETTRQADAAPCTREPTSPTTLQRITLTQFCRSDDSPTNPVNRLLPV